MALRLGKITLAILAVAILGFGAFFMFLVTSVPGEREILERIAILEKQPQPTSCPPPLEGEGLLVEITRMAIVYTVNGNYKKASPFFLRAVEIKKKLCGTEYPGLIGPLLQLAESYDLEGSPDKADPIYLELFELIKKSLEKRNIELVSLKNKPESSHGLEEQEVLHSEPGNISGMLTMSIHMLEMAGKATNAEPLRKRLEWLRSREPK